MNIFLQSKSFRLFLIVCFFKLVLSDESVATTNQANVSNVRFEQVNDRIIITYDLSGHPEKQYDVRIVLHKKSEPAFRFEPKEISGNVGRNIACGEALSAEWNFTEEFPDGLHQGDYFFVGYALEEDETSVSPWVWIGAALIVGGIIFLLVNKAKEDTSGEFPTPPGRPN